MVRVPISGSGFLGAARRGVPGVGAGVYYTLPEGVSISGVGVGVYPRP